MPISTSARMCTCTTYLKNQCGYLADVFLTCTISSAHVISSSWGDSEGYLTGPDLSRLARGNLLDGD